MSGETINYLVFDTEADAVARADSEGARVGYSYHVNGIGTRYKTYPKITTNGKYALNVNNYALTSDEESSTTTSVTFPTSEE
tara:strand:- start:85 stop:330 length:246 start_codon:yes stop_codon:yes gene_type:complete